MRLGRSPEKMAVVGVSRQISTPVHWMVLMAGTVILTACSRGLDTAKIAEAIQDEVIKQGGVSLKQVVCPDRVKLESGQTFECVGILASEGNFAIPVTQQDAQGSVRWSVPSVKGLINLVDLQTSIQQALEKEVGQATIDCGRSTYRAVKPGDRFECKVLKRGGQATATATPLTPKPGNQPGTPASGKPSTKGISPQKSDQPETIMVMVDPGGNVNWQRVFPGADPKATPTPAGQSTTPKASTSDSSAATPVPPKPKPTVTTENIPDPNRPSDNEVLVD